MESEDEWNPRFLAYCQSESKTTNEVLSVPGWGPRFINWNRCRILEFAKEHPEHIAFNTLGSEKAHKAYDAWLIEKFPINNNTKA